MPNRGDLDALIQNLKDLKKEVKVEQVLEAALADPQPTEESLRQVEQALETFQGLGLFDGDDPRNLHLLLTLGQTYEKLSHYEKAFETRERALALAERHGEQDVQAELLSAMGSLLSRRQYWEEALDCLVRSQAIY